jgi:hypothetical protein
MHTYSNSSIDSSLWRRIVPRALPEQALVGIPYISHHMFLLCFMQPD